MAALAIPALAPALASADVQRYQVQEATLTSTVDFLGSQFVHTYKVEIGCGSFTGSGSVLGVPETISGTIGGSNISLNAAYTDGSGYTWTSNGTTGSDNGGRQFTVKNQLTINRTSGYKNHGDYVSAVGGGTAAAHSCIGMPINSGN